MSKKKKVERSKNDEEKEDIEKEKKDAITDISLKPFSQI
jgi:hypothetical protein